jgi:hypothetical protein
MHGLTLWKEKCVMRHSFEIKKTIGLILKLIFIQIREIHTFFLYDFYIFLLGHYL